MTRSEDADIATVFGVSALLIILFVAFAFAYAFGAFSS